MITLVSVCASKDCGVPLYEDSDLRNLYQSYVRWIDGNTYCLHCALKLEQQQRVARDSVKTQ